MGKWPVPSGAIYFHHVVVVRFVPFFFNDRLLANSSVEYSEHTFFQETGAKKLGSRGPIFANFWPFGLSL